MAITELALVDNTHIRISQRIHPVKVGEAEELDGGRGIYTFKPVTFLDELKEQADAGVFYLGSRVTSRSVLLIEDVDCYDTLVKGSGYILVAETQIGVVKTTILDEQQPPKIVTYKKGNFVCYISGRSGMDILNFCTPPFTDDMEVSAEEIGQKEVNGIAIPGIFWDYRRMLLGV